MVLFETIYSRNLNRINKLQKFLLFVLSTGIALSFFMFVQYSTKKVITGALEKVEQKCLCSKD